MHWESPDEQVWLRSAAMGKPGKSSFFVHGRLASSRAGLHQLQGLFVTSLIPSVLGSGSSGGLFH